MPNDPNNNYMVECKHQYSYTANRKSALIETVKHNDLAKFEKLLKETITVVYSYKSYPVKYKLLIAEFIDNDNEDRPWFDKKFTQELLRIALTNPFTDIATILMRDKKISPDKKTVRLIVDQLNELILACTIVVNYPFDLQLLLANRIFPQISCWNLFFSNIKLVDPFKKEVNPQIQKIVQCAAFTLDATSASSSFFSIKQRMQDNIEIYVEKFLKSLVRFNTFYVAAHTEVEKIYLRKFTLFENVLFNYQDSSQKSIEFKNKFISTIKQLITYFIEEIATPKLTKYEYPELLLKINLSIGALKKYLSPLEWHEKMEPTCQELVLALNRYREKNTLLPHELPAEVSEIKKLFQIITQELEPEKKVALGCN